MVWRLNELAERVGATVIGDGSITVGRIRALDRATDEDLSFCSRPAFRQAALDSRAAALVVSPNLVQELSGRTLLVAAQPQVTLAALLELMHPAPSFAPGVHPTAVIGARVELGEGVHVGPYAVVDDDTSIGDHAVIRAHVVIGPRCRLGRRVHLHPHVVLYDETELGDDVILHAGTVLGADGFGYASRPDGVHVKVPQVGRTVIEDDVEIGALSSIDRAALEETRVGAGTKIDNHVQVGHNVALGRGCILCGQVGIGGSAKVGDYTVIGGQSGVVDHLTVGPRTQVASKSAVQSDTPTAGRVLGGVPATDLATWRRQVVAVAKAPELGRRVRALEKRLAALEGDSKAGDEEDR
ncbi:MAG: UDP-3-O-(3-hydroxymyristoyl)glucosamine N-acyltransferase [Acidobacteriota bacterium]